jgi:DNA invertase Pin-like site-specific DNA recombinase
MKKQPAVAYFRTSSAANVGADRDSLPRQRAAVQAFAKDNRFEIVGEYRDDAVSGADAIDGRDGFNAMLDRIEGNGVRTVIVESATRFARTMLAAELGIVQLQKLGVTVLTAAGENLTEEENPERIAMRQMAIVFSQLEKSRLVHKLKAARDRKRAKEGRCEGRKPVPGPVKAEARRLARKSPKTGKRRSYRDIAAEMAAAGYVGPSGKPYFPGSIRAMLASDN